jgi:hypothetical protein
LEIFLSIKAYFIPTDHHKKTSPNPGEVFYGMDSLENISQLCDLLYNNLLR